MVCFHHHDRTAIGTCKHCQRGLCDECAAVIEDVLACKNRHEEEVMAVEQMTARTIFQSKRVGSAYSRNAIFYGLVGALFTAFGVYQYPFLGLQAVFFILIGLFLLYAAAANYFEARKHRK
jgi:hypothetical protein